MRGQLMQVAFGAAVILFGAWLIGRWAVGIALALIGIFLLIDGMLRNTADETPQVDEAATPLEPKSFDEIINNVRRLP